MFGTRLRAAVSVVPEALQTDQPASAAQLQNASIHNGLLQLNRVSAAGWLMLGGPAVGPHLTATREISQQDLSQLFVLFLICSDCTQLSMMVCRQELNGSLVRVCSEGPIAEHNAAKELISTVNSLQQAADDVLSPMLQSTEVITS